MNHASQVHFRLWYWKLIGGDFACLLVELMPELVVGSYRVTRVNTSTKKGEGKKKEKRGSRDGPVQGSYRKKSQDQKIKPYVVKLSVS